jgi:glyoxylase-like metal-dependent hydrolase (beta-lactamase superfamily II)
MADKVPPSAAIREDFFVLSFGFVSMYAFRAEDSLIVFDTGMRQDAVRREFARLGLQPGQVKAILLTHSDRDHTGGIGAFPGAPLYVPKDEIPMTDRSTPRLFGLFHNRPLPRAYETLSDSQELRFGSQRVLCISTPGHTVGSMSFLVNRSILVVGDILNLSQGKAVMDREMINIDREKRRQSIRKLAALQGVSLLCTMHSGYTTDFERAMRAWRS